MRTSGTAADSSAVKPHTADYVGGGPSEQGYAWNLQQMRELKS